MGRIRELLDRIGPWEAASRRRKIKRFADRYEQWRAGGRELPMPHYGKQLVVAEYAERLGPRVLVETGTYTGHMVLAMLDRFERIYSIELDAILHAKVGRRFARHSHVHLLQGASEEVLPNVLEQIKQPCVFWLDAHYSGGQTARGTLDTPILQEIRCILAHCCADEHVLLIDDARSFTGQNDYPTLEELRNVILTTKAGWHFEVKDDIIRAHRPLPGRAESD